MFRLQMGDKDPIEEKRVARENTVHSLITFFVLCTLIRVAPAVLKSLS